MEITLHNTNKIATINGIEARIWEGETSKGIRVHAYITRIAVSLLQDQAEFEQELYRADPRFPDDDSIPLRLLI